LAKKVIEYDFLHNRFFFSLSGAACAWGESIGLPV
jgi:hypothetical protein